MSDIADRGSTPSQATSEHDDLVRALTVERFTRWKPSTSAEDRTKMGVYPTVRDGLPFQPNARTVRARKYRRNVAVPGRNA